MVPASPVPSNVSSHDDPDERQWKTHLTHVWNAVVNNIDHFEVREALRELVDTLLANEMRQKHQNHLLNMMNHWRLQEVAH